MKCKHCKQDITTVKKAFWCSMQCKFLTNIYVNDTQCWLWTKTTKHPKDIRIRHKMKWYSLYKLSYELFNGSTIHNKKFLTRCNTDRCISPDHLYIETKDTLLPHKPRLRDSLAISFNNCCKSLNNLVAYMFGRY